MEERSSSNCENEASVAVNNIKTLLDLGNTGGGDDGGSRPDGMITTFGPMMDMHRNDNYHPHHIAITTTTNTTTSQPIRNNHSNHHPLDATPFQKRTTTTGTSHRRNDLAISNHGGGPIRLWSEEPPRPEHSHPPPKSEYHLAKERLLSQRQRRAQQNSISNSNRNSTNGHKPNSVRTAEVTDLQHLTLKHDDLVRKSNEYRTNRSIASTNTSTNTRTNHNVRSHVEDIMREVILIEQDPMMAPLSPSHVHYTSPDQSPPPPPQQEQQQSYSSPTTSSPRNYKSPTATSPKSYTFTSSPRNYSSLVSPNSMSNRLFIDTSDMEQLLEDVAPLGRTKKFDGNDLVSAFGYEFNKRHENDEQSDIIVIDDVLQQQDRMSEASKRSMGDPTSTAMIAGQNVAARYEAIRHSVAGRISNMERTQIHPLAYTSTTSPTLRTVPEMSPPTTTKPRDISPSKIHFIRDQVKSLQEQQQQHQEQHIDVITNASELDESLLRANVNKELKKMEESIGKEPPSPQDAITNSPSRASAIEGLIALESIKSLSKQDPMSLDDDFEVAPLSAEAEYRKKSKGSNTTRPFSPKLLNQEDESDFIAITRNLSSKTFMADILNESSTVFPSPANNAKNDPHTETPIETSIQATDVDPHPDNSTNHSSVAIREASETDAQSLAIIKKESPMLTTAAELCVGFCANNGDSISVPDKGMEMTFDHNDPLAITLSAINSVGSAVDPSTSIIEHTDPTLSNTTSHGGLESQKESELPIEPAQSRNSAQVNLTKGKSNERRKESRVNDLALSDEDSSESYPSDVDVNNEDDMKYLNQSKFITASNNTMVKYTDTVDTKMQSSKSVVSTATESNIKRNTEASISDNASFVSDNSGTRASLGDSDNSDSDDEDTGIYDSCFARQIFDDTCAWLERDETSFCFRPSLLKKVKRRNVGQIKKYYGRSPLVLRVPRNPIITRNYLQSRRKVQENPVPRSRKSKPNSNSNMKNSESQSALLRFRQNKTIFGADVGGQSVSVANHTAANNLDIEKVDVGGKYQESIEDVVTPVSSNISKATETEMHTNEYSVAESSGVFEADSKNLAIFEVKSAEEYTSHHFTTYQQSLRSRSMSPVFLTKKRNEFKANDSSQKELVDIQSTNKSDHIDVIAEVCAKIVSSRSREQMGKPKQIVEDVELKPEPIDCTGTKAIPDASSTQWKESPDSPGFNEYEDTEFSNRPKSRREGLAKLRHHKSPVRHELIQLEHVESEMDSTDNSVLNEEQRLAALDMAEKLRRRAMTLRRRRKLRERRREVRCMDSQMVVT